MHFQQHVSSHECTYISLLGIIFRKLARDLTWLKSNGITHVVNCAQGKRFGQVDTDASYYDQTGIQYFGIPGHDSVKFDITKHFEESSSFIDEGNKSGMSVKVLISIPRYLVWNALSTIRASLRSLVLSLKYTNDIKLFIAVCMIPRSSQLWTYYLANRTKIFSVLKAVMEMPYYKSIYSCLWTFQVPSNIFNKLSHRCISIVYC